MRCGVAVRYYAQQVGVHFWAICNYGNIAWRKPIIVFVLTLFTAQGTADWARIQPDLV
jgi:hypothetical protein